MRQPGCRRATDGQLPSLVHEATSSPKVQNSATCSHSDRILLAFLSAALTPDVRRQFFVVVDAAQNVVQSLVAGLTNRPRVNCTLGLDLAVSLILKTPPSRHARPASEISTLQRLQADVVSRR
jgi:hypothetical protein